MTGRDPESLYGAGDVSALFGKSPVTAVPWKPAGQLKNREPYDKSLVEKAVREGQEPEPVDPRNLRSMQPSVTRAGVEHYLSGTDELFADSHQSGNRHPVVYNRDGTNLLLSGNHRATAALLRGEQFNAVQVKGSWGPER